MELHAILTTLVSPPLAPLLGMLLALLFWCLPDSSPVTRLSLPLAILSFATLWICATPAFSSWLGSRLVGEVGIETAGEVAGEMTDASAAPQAVVVLGGGRYRDGNSGNERLSATSLERIAWAAQHAPGQLPVLVSGGRVYAGERAPESQLMASVMEDLLQRSVSWRDNCSRTTAENAVNSARILHDSGIERVVLVTHWWHMPRAARVFSRAGLQVQPLPVGSPSERLPRAQEGVLRWLPSAGALLRTQVYWRELLGSAWYHWRPLPAARRC